MSTFFPGNFALLPSGRGNDSPRRDKAGDPVASARESAVEKTRHDPGAGEPEEDSGTPVPHRTTENLGDCHFTGEDRPSRQNEVHRLEARGLGDRGESPTGFRGTAGEELESVWGHGVAPDPVGGRAADRALRIIEKNRGHQQIRGSWSPTG